MGAWNLYSSVLWYAEFDGLIFIKILLLSGVVSPFFDSKANFVSFVTIDGYD